MSYTLNFFLKKLFLALTTYTATLLVVTYNPGAVVTAVRTKLVISAGFKKLR